MLLVSDTKGVAYCSSYIFVIHKPNISTMGSEKAISLSRAASTVPSCTVAMSQDVPASGEYVREKLTLSC